MRKKRRTPKTANWKRKEKEVIRKIIKGKRWVGGRSVGSDRQERRRKMRKSKEVEGRAVGNRKREENGWKGRARKEQKAGRTAGREERKTRQKVSKRPDEGLMEF